MFCEKLDKYMTLAGCSGKKLAELSGISEATISRYKSGERTPKANSEDMKKLCRGIYAAAQQAKTDVSYKDIWDDLNDIAADEPFDYDAMRKKFDSLCSALSVNASDMSKKLKYDSSYVSRIRSGKRRPANPGKFVFGVTEYIVRYHDSENEKKIVAKLVNTDYNNIKTKEAYACVLESWLGEGGGDFENPVRKFLNALNEFDLNEYIKAIRFDELKVPTLPFQLPVTKNYYGIEEMKQGELDFLKATALSRSKADVFMCSDMQMDDMAADLDFSKKYMFGLAAMLKKGLHLNVVHNLNRPFDELMLGLECWIPLYMTGQISPYYLKGVHNHIYCHFLNVSDAAALEGESISGYHSKGRYRLTKNREELAYFHERADCILKKAQPLMEIYREDNANGLKAFLILDEKTGGNRKNILSTLPIYTASPEFLERFLDRRGVAGEGRKRILAYAEDRRRRMLEILQDNFVSDEIPCPNQDEFEKNPIGFSTSHIFGDENFTYSYEEYAEHLRLTKEFAARVKNYSFVETRVNAFKNIDIMINENKYVLISKNNSPSIHFVVRYPILCAAIENLEFPVYE